jgi:hypothetical protein
MPIDIEYIEKKYNEILSINYDLAANQKGASLYNRNKKIKQLASYLIECSQELENEFNELLIEEQEIVRKTNHEFLQGISILRENKNLV